MKNKIYAIISLICVFASVLCIGAGAYAPDKAQGIVDDVLCFFLESSGSKTVGDWIEGELCDNAGVGSEWFVLALSQSGEYDFSAYEAALLNYLSQTKVYSASSRQKFALSLSAVGSTDGYISSVMEDSIGEQGLMSFVFGLHLLNNGYTSSKHTVASVTERMMSLQIEDGGWSVMGRSGDVDATSMVIQSLAPYYGTDTRVRESIDKALVFLSSSQLEDGGYLGLGVANAESCAQVLVALCSLGIDAESDARFIKNGKTVIDAISEYRLDNGGYSHEKGGAYSKTATAQVLYSAVAYIRASEGRSPLYILDLADAQNVKPAPSTPVLDDDRQDTEQGDIAQPQKASYKLYACIIIVGVGAVLCVVLLILGKKSVKNYLAILVCVALAIAVVLLTNIRSADDYYNGEDSAKENAIGSVTLSIHCDTVAGRAEHIPANGIILESESFDIEDGDTVYDVLVEAARKHKIQIENNGSKELAYIVGINYIYEFDFGDLSGWVYRVNGETLSVGCGECELSDGDVIEWMYTCELGDDLK